MTQDATSRRIGTMRATVVLTSVALGLFGTASMPAAKRVSPFSTHTFQFRLEGSQVVPPVNNTDGSGWCAITLDDQTGAYSVAGGYTCLRGDVTDIHLHGPAPAGQEGGIITQIPNSGGTSGTFSRNGTLASQLVQDMVNGLIYVQLHSSFRTAGELRGQVVPCSAASVSARNGSGINPLVLSSPSPPVMNTTWTAALDCSGHAPSIAVLFVYARPSSGTVIGAGEILVRTAGKRLYRTSLPHAGGVVTFSAPVPADATLCGLSAHAQAVVFGSPGPRLTNALQLVVGQ